MKDNQPGLIAYIIEIFVLANLAFLIIDIYMAHSVNHFEHPSEWIPFFYSIIGSILLATFVLKGKTATFSNYGIWMGYVIGGLGIIIGIAGLFYHLSSQYFIQMTIKNLVYTAPFVAPLSYAGLGFILVMNRSVPHQNIEWSNWIIFFAWGGFVGNFILSVCDHAQNGFYYTSEWIPVITSGITIGFLLLPIITSVDKWYLLITVLILLLQCLVGVLGFILHFFADIHGYSESIYKNFVYGAPVFAPLLFPNIAVLALIGLWDYYQKKFS